MIKWDQQIFASLGLRVRYPELCLGIELEYERMRDAYPALEFWALERDPSLRNHGVEYISVPLTLEALPSALEEAQESVAEHNLQASWRCGVHTHVNVSYWTWKQLLTHAALYAVVEPYLFGTFAPGRETCHFCVPMWANINLVDSLANDAIALRAGRASSGQLALVKCSKYSALNYRPLTEQGTIEFRHMPGTTDMAKVREWCDFLARLTRVAHAYEVPEAVVNDVEDMGIEYVLEKVGLHTCEVAPEVIDDAYIAACMVVGHDPQKWQDLEWDAEYLQREVEGHDDALVGMEARILDILEGDE